MARVHMRDVQMELFLSCYSNNGKAYDLHRISNGDTRKDEEIEAIYYNGLADSAEHIIETFGWKDDYYRYCDHRDRGWSHAEIIAKHRSK